MKDLREMTSKELKEMAKDLRISNWWNLKKEVLIRKIEEKQAEEHTEEIETVEEPTSNVVPIKSNRRRRTPQVVEEVRSKAPNSSIEEVSDETKENVKPKHKKPNLKLTELTYNGETKSIREWAVELNMPWPTLYDRVNRNGWTVEDAIEIPLGQRRSR